MSALTEHLRAVARRKAYAVAAAPETYEVWKAADEIERLEAALAELVAAWESLLEGNHPAQVIQSWLVNKMKPAMDRARKAKAEKEGERT